MWGRTKGVSQCLWKPTAHFLCIINRNPDSLLRKGVKKPKQNSIIKSKHPELPWSCFLWSFAQTNTQTRPPVRRQRINGSKSTHMCAHTHIQVSSCACAPSRRRCQHPAEGYQRSSWRSPGLRDSVALSAVFKTRCPGALPPGAVNQSHRGGA